VKGVFDLEPGSPYGDSPDRYYIGSRKDYLAVARAAEGDWILYRESKRSGGRKGYVGAARVVSIEKDGIAGYCANLADYFAFDPPVPLKDSSGVYREEMARQVTDSRLMGVTFQGKSVRPISDSDFAAVVSTGLGTALLPENLQRYGPTGPDANDIPVLGASDSDDEAFVRRIETTLINRKVRDANFRRLVCRAYDDTCAVTGLRIINGGGRSEVQAAHIWPVEHGGPDTVRNGLALSGTVHWLFDRHLISLTDDYRLLVAHNRVPEALRGLFQHQMDRIRLPRNKSQWPDPKYVSRHRERYGAY